MSDLSSKRPASGGGMNSSGQPLMMCSAVCSDSLHWHASLSAWPRFFMREL